MMFAARGLAVSLSVFALLYFALSLAVCCLSRTNWLHSRRVPAGRRANLLFAWRMFPLAAAAFLTLAFAVPSFLWLEPRSIEEPVGAIPLALGLCGLMLLLAGTWNAARALLRASNMVARWQNGASEERSGSVRLLRVSQEIPTLVAAGILRPKVLLSHRAEFVLTPKELRTALRHEVAHLRRFDNLRKLLMRFSAFPGMAELEAAWRESAEMSADDAAVSSASEALDLATALIKLSRLGPLEPPAELTTALVHSPAETVHARVQRLIEWNETARRESQAVARGFGPQYAVPFVSVLILAIATIYGPLLLSVHAATEWLVR